VVEENVIVGRLISGGYGVRRLHAETHCQRSYTELEVAQAARIAARPTGEEAAYSLQSLEG